MNIPYKYSYQGDQLSQSQQVTQAQILKYLITMNQMQRQKKQYQVQNTKDMGINDINEQIQYKLFQVLQKNLQLLNLLQNSYNAQNQFLASRQNGLKNKNLDLQTFFQIQPQVIWTASESSTSKKQNSQKILNQCKQQQNQDKSILNLSTNYLSQLIEGPNSLSSQPFEVVKKDSKLGINLKEKKLKDFYTYFQNSVLSEYDLTSLPRKEIYEALKDVQDLEQTVVHSYIDSINNYSLKMKRSKAPSKYRGVSKNGRYWQVLINLNKKKIYINSFKSERQAAQVYDKAALLIQGIKARTNFSYTKRQLLIFLKENIARY